MVSESDATDEQTAFMQRAKAALGVDFVPALFASMAGATGPANGTLAAITGVLGTGALSGVLKQTMMVAIATDRHCSYCAAVHSVLCKMLGVPDEQVAAIRTMLDSDSVDRDWAAVRFAVQAANRPLTVGDEDTQRLRDVGLTDEQIAEIGLVAGLGAMVCVFADSMGLKIDPQVRAAL